MTGAANNTGRRTERNQPTKERKKDMTQSIEDKIAELEKRRDQLNARIKQIQARQNAKARKARARRLYQLGEIMEKAMGIELDEAGRQILSQTLNSVITVYDPRRGMNVDMKVIDVIDNGIPRTAPKNEPSPDGTAIMPDDDAIVERDRNKREMEPDESEETHSYDPSSDADPSGKPVKPAEERTRKRKTKTPAKPKPATEAADTQAGR